MRPRAKEAPDFVREESGALINTNRQALKAYKIRKAKTKSMTERIEALEELVLQLTRNMK